MKPPTYGTLLPKFTNKKDMTMLDAFLNNKFAIALTALLGYLICRDIIRYIANGRRKKTIEKEMMENEQKIKDLMEKMHNQKKEIFQSMKDFEKMEQNYFNDTTPEDEKPTSWPNKTL